MGRAILSFKIQQQRKGDSYSAILIKKGIPFNATKIISDVNGHFIIAIDKL